MKWTRRAAIQRILARVPGGRTFYYQIGQKRLGQLRSSDNFLRQKISNGKELLGILGQAGGTVEGKATVEIGTGNVPIIPLVFWLEGHQTCVTVDRARILDPQQTIANARKLTQHSIGKAERRHALQQITLESPDIHKIMALTNISYQIGHDPFAKIPAKSADVVYTNTVLEHVPAQEIRELLAQTRRILRPSGHTIHLIDTSDHFSHDDPHITSINFLRFSPEEFDKYQSWFLYQNRMRPYEYRRLFEEAGFKIVLWKITAHIQALERLPRQDLHPAFSNLEAEELTATVVYVVAQPA